MSRRDPYRYMEAFIEPNQVGWTASGLRQPVTVMMVDDTGEVTAACPLDPERARNLAFELLVCAEHAERLSDDGQARR
jgi:hypothetical protein